MMGLLEQLMDITEEPTKVDILSNIKISGEALLLLVRNLLDIARLDAGAVHLTSQVRGSPSPSP